MNEMTNALEKELHHYIRQLNEAEKLSVLQLLKTFLNGQKETADEISIQQYNLELHEAEAEFERGEYITHEELLEQIKQ